MVESTTDQVAMLARMSQDLCARSQALRAHSVALSAQLAALHTKSQDLCAWSLKICDRSQAIAARLQETARNGEPDD
jgi:uncharacterized protein (DUF3084 family)